MKRKSNQPLEFKRQQDFSYSIKFFLFIAGGLFLIWFNQEMSWERSKKEEIFRRDISTGTALIDETSNLIKERLYLLQQTYWGISESEPEDANEYWKLYNRKTIEWNSTISSLIIKIEGRFGEEAALILKNYSDEVEEDPRSLHYAFYQIQENMKILFRQKITYADPDQELMTTVENQLSEITGKADTFITTLENMHLTRSAGYSLTDRIR